jgi:hypothetical protein
VEDGPDGLTDPEVAREPTLGTPAIRPHVFKGGFGTVPGDGFGHGQHLLEPAHMATDVLVGPGERQIRTHRPLLIHDCDCEEPSATVTASLAAGSGRDRLNGRAFTEGQGGVAPLEEFTVAAQPAHDADPGFSSHPDEVGDDHDRPIADVPCLFKRLGVGLRV